jgi:hypothetical protein
LYLVLIVLDVVGVGADGAVGILFARSLLLLFQFDVFSMAPEDEDARPFVEVILLLDPEEFATAAGSLDLFAKALLVLQEKT